MDASTTPAPILIIGASQAGVQLAASLRDLGETAPITLVDAQSRAPYQRPPLSKGYLKGEVTGDDLVFRTLEWYREHDIRLVLGEKVVDVRGNADGSGVAVTDTGKQLPFGRLALATGAAPRRLDIPGIDALGIHVLRDADDAEALAADLASASRVVVIGGGFIGLEVAAGARALGKTVTVLEAAPRLVGRVVCEETSAFYLDAHRRRGIEVILDARIAAIRESGDRVSGVELEDGTVIPAEVVVVGIGVVPHTELAELLGLDLDGGIVVNEFGIASDGRTVVAGDGAVMPNPYARGSQSHVRLESVHNAIEHAKVAAAALVGAPVAYVTMPWFWSDQADLKLQIAGLSTGYDETVLRGDPATEKFSVLYYCEGQLIAADCVNQPIEFMTVRSALARGATIPREAAANTAVPLKQSVVDPTAVVA